MKALITLTILATLTSATSFASISHKKTTQNKAFTIAKGEDKFECQKKINKSRWANTSGIQTNRPTSKAKTGIGG